MKILLILSFLLLNCSGDITTETEKTKEKQVYYDCYHVSQDKFKKISKIDYVGVKLEDMCNEESFFLPDLEDEICQKACRDAFNHYK